jgi:hypothetical protein
MTNPKDYTWTIQVNADESYLWRVFDSIGTVVSQGKAPSRAAAVRDAKVEILALKRIRA